MVSLTLRNIPEEVLNRIRIFAMKERRSLNSEMVLVLEEGLLHRIEGHGQNSDLPSDALIVSLSTTAREHIWEELKGAWKEDRPLSEIISCTYLLRDQ